MLNTLVKDQSSTIDIEDLRQYAKIIHHLKCVELDKVLWNKYLQSGTGELMKEEHIRSMLMTSLPNKLPLLQYWPMDIKLRMIQRGQTTATDPKHIDHESCLDYVQRVLLKFDQQIKFYQNQYRILKQRIQSFITDKIEDSIVTFVRQNGISLYRIYIDKSIASIEYDYKDQLIQFEFRRECPNSYQKQTFETLFQLKRATEEAKFDIAILKQRIAHKQLPKSFHTIRIPTTINFNTIQDNNVRQRLQDQCEKILQRTTSDMMLVSIALAETKFNECQIKFDKEMTKMKKNQQIDDFYERFNQKTLDLLYRRLSLLDERLMCVYNLKLRFFDKAPTVMN